MLITGLKPRKMPPAKPLVLNLPKDMRSLHLCHEINFLDR